MTQRFCPGGSEKAWEIRVVSERMVSFDAKRNRAGGEKFHDTQGLRHRLQRLAIPGERLRGGVSRQVSLNNIAVYERAKSLPQSITRLGRLQVAVDH